MFRRVIGFIGATLVMTANVALAEEVLHAVHGTVETLETSTKRILVKTREGSSYALRIGDAAVVHTADDASNASRDSWKDLERGSDVVAHYTLRGGEKTVVELDKIGDGGLKVVRGSVKDFDTGAKKLVIETDKGIDETFHLTEHASDETGRAVGESLKKGRSVTVYYTDDAARKVAHFFE